jgi:hypothetical protein
MSLLQELATQVLLGSERRQPMLPSVTGPIGDLLDSACPHDVDVEVRVLRAAGAMAICADAGFVPAGTAEDLPDVCPPDENPPVLAPALVSVLRQIIDDGPDPLRREALRRLTSKSACLPPQLLPRALSLAQSTPELRVELLPVLGVRGRWLAKFNPAWSYAVGNVEQAPNLSLWEEGTLEQRKHLLGRLRATDPAKARNLLQEGFAHLEARERVSLLELLGPGLSSADEEFLEENLADRSKEVRQLAAALLSRLPTSRYGIRMAERMTACLGQERKFFRQVLTLEAPVQFASDWKADALEESRAKTESLGERAWWLYQMARALPLAWWTAKSGMSPAELIEWVQDTDWSEAIARAWSEALKRSPDAGWAAAFLAKPPAKGLTLDVFDLLACLPITEREAHWLRMLVDGQTKIARGDLLGRIVRDVSGGGSALSAEFSRRVLKEIRNALPSDACKWDYALRKTLPEFVCLVPPACVPEAAQGWPVGRPETEYFNECLARVLAIVEQRQTLHRSQS